MGRSVRVLLDRTRAYCVRSSAHLAEEAKRLSRTELFYSSSDSSQNGRNCLWDRVRYHALCKLTAGADLRVVAR